MTVSATSMPGRLVACVEADLGSLVGREVRPVGVRAPPLRDS
jgi:hypothetical protein